MTAESLLTVRDVSRRFQGITALSDVNLDVPLGQITGIIGPNGAGKTTLFDVITGFLKPNTGRVTFEGRDITGTPAHRIAHRGLVRVFQEARTFSSMTVWENVLVGFTHQPRESALRVMDWRGSVRQRERETRQRTAELLRMVNLLNKSEEMGSSLSYGQQKLLCIIRALAGNPKLLLLDEPCAGLAPSMIRVLEGVLREIIDEGRTIVLIEHNTEFVRTCSNYVIFMHNGTAARSGDPETLFADEELSRVYFGLAG